MAKSPMPFFPGDLVEALEHMDDVDQGERYTVDRTDYEERSGEWIIRLQAMGTTRYQAKYFGLVERGEHLKPMSSMISEFLKTVPRKKVVK